MGAGGYREMMLFREERHQANFSTHTPHTQLSKLRSLGGPPEDLGPAGRLCGLHGPISLLLFGLLHGPPSSGCPEFFFALSSLPSTCTAGHKLPGRQGSARRQTGLNRESPQFP